MPKTCSGQGKNHIICLVKKQESISPFLKGKHKKLNHFFVDDGPCFINGHFLPISGKYLLHFFFISLEVYDLTAFPADKMVVVIAKEIEMDDSVRPDNSQDFSFFS